MTAPENPPRWATDPLGRHQYRYWDGTEWTEHVADDGMVGVDPPVFLPPPRAGDPPAAPLPGTGAAAWTTNGARHDPTAVLGRRYGAFFIDAAICMVAFALLFFPFSTKRTRAEALQLPGCHLSGTDSSQVECDNRAVITINDTVYEANLGSLVALCALFTFLYFAVVEGLFGGSLGKLMTGLRVVTPDGTRIGIARSSARWALFAIDGPLTIFICGIVTSSASKGHRRLGDMAANSYVVRRIDADRPIVVR